MEDTKFKKGQIPYNKGIKKKLDLDKIKKLPLDKKIEKINEIRKELHKISPFKNEPVDLVIWVKNEEVLANDYNPNSVAPPEMELLKISITDDGYTQPIVTFKEDKNIVVDGFHRNRVGKECEEIKKRIHGYLPIVSINEDRIDRGDRIASTIRHNRARGKHKIDAMSDIILELKRRCWSDEKIGNKLGMDKDEVLRLGQITGLADIFKDKEFSEAWEVEKFDEVDEVK
jgi:ParB-like chromosome segregation protein Spo0J